MNADGRKGSSACKEPRIDPLKLLTCLKVLLDPNAGIRSANEVKRLAELMAKYSKKLVSKCIYIQILKSTDTELLGKFMGVGGWLLTHMWLSDAIKAANWPLVQEILELLLLCPVDVQRLRSNTAPKLVKGLSRDGGNEGVRILATRLVEQWLKVVKGETMAAAGTSAPCDQTPGVPVEGGVSSMVPGADGIAQSANKSANDAHFGQNLISPTGDAVPNGLMSQKGKSDEALIYKIVSKDGKQVVAKVTNGGEAGAGDVSAVDGKSADESADSKTDDEDKQSNKENETKGGESEDKDAKDGDKEKSRSKDKDRHRDHKSSSSRHKSSSSSKSSSKSSSSSSSKSKSSHNSSNSSSSSKHKDKESSDKDKHRSSSKSSSSSSSKDKSRSKDRDREKSRSSSDNKDKSRSDRDKERERSDKERRDSDSDKPRSDTDKDKLPSIDKLGKIPKKIKEEETPLIQSITIPSKKASMSIEIRRGDPNRPKTVKTYNSQFRSHGLSEEAPPPPSRKGLRKPPPQSIPGTSIPSNVLLGKRLSPPPSIPSTTVVANATVKDFQPPVEKKLKIDLNTAPATEKPGAVKFIAPKPKPSTLVESDMFMDALSAAAPLKKDIRKRKRRTSASKEPGKEPTTPDDPESPVASKVTPLKFYQDTLEDDKTEMFDDKDDNSDDKKGNDDEDDIPLKKVKEQIEEKVREEKELEERRMRENEEPEEPVKKPPGPGCGPDGPPGVLMLHRRKGPKKKLTWKPQANLEEVRFFELDENERVNVTKTFTDMKQMERFNEREAFMLARKLNADDTMVEQTPWVPLIEIDDVPAHPEGSQSKEKKIQMERELTTLKALYFNRHMIPHSPSEPDMEQYQITEPAVIPLDDITGNPDAINDFTSMPWPDPKGSPPQGDEFMSGSDMGFPGGQFNPFMSFPGNGGWMGAGLNNGPPNAMMPPMGGPMGNFNPMMGGPPSNMMMNGGPPNMMMGPPDDMGMNCNMNMMQPNFGLGLNGPNGPNFGGPPNGMGGGFNNFGPPMGMNHNMNMNMNNGPPRGGGGGHRGGGNWRSGTVGPSGPNDGPGGVWRGGGRGGGGNPRRGGGGGGGGGGGVGRGDNTRPICKQFQRGFCRNGNKCNFFHPPGVNQRF